MASTGSVPSFDLARWLGTERGWIERLAASGELVSEREGAALLVDPTSLEDWMHRRRGDAGGRDDAGLGMLGVVGGILGSGGPAEPVAQGVIEHLTQRFGAAWAAIFLALGDPAPGNGGEMASGKGSLRLVASSRSGNGGPPASQTTPVTEACGEIAHWVHATGRPISLCDPRRVGLPGGDASGPRDILAVPVRVGSRVLGVLALLRRIDQPAFGARDRSLASIVCTQLGLAVERSRYEDMLGRRLEEANLVHRQLEAYARDVRETYAAEKQRAEDLARALGELERTYLATVRGLAVAVEAKDEYTGGHLVRVTSYGLMIMQRLAPELANQPQFEYGFLLHDVGKLGVPDAVLKKPGPLDDDEWELMRRHPTTGRRILEGIPFLTEAKEIVYSHHERWDGKGYPKGLRGDEVVLGGRVFPIADTFDAMTSDRPYRKAMPFDRAIDEIARGSGSQFWPDAVEAFLSIPRHELEAAAQARRDGWGDE
ncbi:MAG TPA: HD domain-containing phosphohydrolase [Actinomycetota bacterium]|jgi:ribonuclease P protein subunit RPR2